MKKAGLCLTSAMIITMVWPVTASQAARKYSEGRTAKSSAPSEMVAPNNSGPRVPSNPAIELVRLHNEWGPLRFAELSHKTREGWMRAMFKGSLRPEKTLSRSLEIENLELIERISYLEKEKSILSQSEKHLSDKLEKIQADYENLKTKSVDYFLFKEDHESVKTALTLAQENMKSLAQENESLRISSRIKWTITGVLMLFTGWIAGLFMGKRRKKRRPIYRV